MAACSEAGDTRVRRQGIEWRRGHEEETDEEEGSRRTDRQTTRVRQAPNVGEANSVGKDEASPSPPAARREEGGVGERRGRR